MFNKIILVGNLTKDIEMRFTQAGLAIANTSIATNRKFKSSNGEQKEEVCFVDITFFARSAEIANQYLHRGSKILVEGRLKLDQWTDQNGQKRSKHSISVETMQMLGERNSNSEHISSNPTPTVQQAMQANTYPQNKQEPQTYARPNPNDIPSIDLDDDEIPF